MKAIRIYAQLALLMLVGGMTMQAQNISGKVVDETNQSVPYANVVQLSQDSTFLGGCVTDENGAFQMAKVQNAALLKVSFVGYKDKWLPLSGTQTNLGTIQLELDAVSLKEVTVSAGLPDVYFKGDAQVTTVENSILAEVGAADDVLGKIPGIVKNNDKLTVFGKGEPLVFINGRQVRDHSELEQLNAKDIQRVELVTNPGAKYDATVGAVVRIVTKKNPNEGLGVDVRSSVYQSAANTDLRDIVSLNYRKKGWQLLATVDYRDVTYLQHSSFIQENKVENDWIQQYTVKENMREARVNSVFEANYSFGNENIVGIRYCPTFWALMDDSIHINSVVKMDGAYYDQLESRQQLRYDYDMGHRVNAFYLGKLGNTSIDFNADFLSNGQTNHSNGIEHSSEWDDRVIQWENPVKNSFLAGKLTFSTPLFGGEISYGGQASFTSRRDDYISHSEYAETSFTQIKDRNLAAFVEYSRMVPFSETVIGSFAVGCRYEHAAYDYYEQDQPIDGQSRKFDHVFPSASLSMQIDKVQLMASYSAKTSRPSYRDLRNSVEYINRFTLQTGNSLLEPWLIHDFSLMASWKFMQFSAGFQDAHNAIIEWAEPVEGSSYVSLLKPRNFDRIPQMWTMVSVGPTIGVWNPKLSVGFSKQWFSVESQDEIVHFDKITPFGSFTNIFVLPKDWTINADLYYSGKGHSGISYRFKDAWVCNLSVQKAFFDKSLTVTLGISDLFNQTSYCYENYYSRLRITKNGTDDSREIYLTVRYRLKAKTSKYRGSLAGEEERQRL
jgi:hypothetical protein